MSEDIHDDASDVTAAEAPADLEVKAFTEAVAAGKRLLGTAETAVRELAWRAASAAVSAVRDEVRQERARLHAEVPAAVADWLTRLALSETAVTAVHYPIADE